MSTWTDADCSAMESQHLHQYKCQADLLVCKQGKNLKTLTVLTTSQYAPLTEHITTSGFVKGIKYEYDEVSDSSCQFGGLREGRRAFWTIPWKNKQPSKHQTKTVILENSKKVFHYYKSWKKTNNFLKSNNTVLGCIHHKKVTLYK